MKHWKEKYVYYKKNAFTNPRSSLVGINNFTRLFNFIHGSVEDIEGLRDKISSVS